MDTEYALSWNDHKAAFHSIVGDLYLDEKLADVALFADGKYFPAHRLVLCACSDYFKKVFEHCSNKDTAIILKDVGSEDLRDLLNFMYKGEVSVLGSSLKSFMQSAENLQIRGLTKNNKCHEIDTNDLLEETLLGDSQISDDATPDMPEERTSGKGILSSILEKGYFDGNESTKAEDLVVTKNSGTVAAFIKKETEEIMVCDDMESKFEEPAVQYSNIEDSWSEHIDRENWPDPIDLENAFPESIKSALLNETPPNKRLVSLILDSIYEYIKQYTYYPSSSQYHDLAHSFLSAFRYLEKYFYEAGKSAHMIWVCKFREKFRNSRKRSDRYSIRPRNLRKFGNSQYEKLVGSSSMSTATLHDTLDQANDNVKSKQEEEPSQIECSGFESQF